MTLTTLLPTLRASIPDPIAADHWPAGTHATLTDIVVDGVSLHDLALLCTTPCVHLAEASRGPISVVVTTVLEAFTAADGTPTLVLDADLAGAGTAWRELRLLGRASRARCVPTAVCVRDAHLRAAGEAWLPGDVAVGDQLGVPCRGALTRHDVEPAARGARAGRRG
ncbi:MAG: hypothetical protein FWF90_00690 [Promicromonosporaceae bacterium]|nr:hypothetical protein [Promicromonosporaceae bacterium]